MDKFYATGVPQGTRYRIRLRRCLDSEWRSTMNVTERYIERSRSDGTMDDRRIGTKGMKKIRHWVWEELNRMADADMIRRYRKNERSYFWRR